MKTFFLCFALACACVSSPAQLATSGQYVGDYIGIAMPAGSCSSERLVVLITVNADYSLTGSIVDWDNTELLQFAAGWPSGFDRNRFDSSLTHLDSYVRGSLNAKAGSMAGIVDLRPSGGCRYSFKAYRRFKHN